MYYPPSYLWHFLVQTSIFVYDFYSGVNFCGKKIAVILFCGNLFLRIEKNRKNLVPHGNCLNLFVRPALFFIPEYQEGHQEIPAYV